MPVSRNAISRHTCLWTNCEEVWSAPVDATANGPFYVTLVPAIAWQHETYGLDVDIRETVDIYGLPQTAADRASLVRDSIG